MPIMNEHDKPDKIEVTEEMVEAGVYLLWQSGYLEKWERDQDGELVKSIFLCMDRLRLKRLCM